MAKLRLSRAHRVMMLATTATIGVLVGFQLNRSGLRVDVLVDQTLVVDDEERMFRLVVPHSMPSDRIPLVVALHGIGDSTESMASYSRLDRLAARHGFLLVYPEAERAMWKTIGATSSNFSENPDVRFLDELLVHLTSRYAIDSDRIYLAGMSNGASFAQLLAFVRTDVAAVVAHSGVKPTELARPQTAFPIMLVVGADDLASGPMRRLANEYRDNGHDVKLIVVPDCGHEWSHRNNDQIWEFLSRHNFNNQ